MRKVVYKDCWKERSRQLYNSKRWKTIRQITLHKDGGLCNYCKQKDIIRAADVVDHITPHRGDPKLFYDVNNLQILCKECHDIKTYNETNNHKSNRYPIDVRINKNNIRLLVCAPGTDYKDYIKDKEIVIDDYVIASRIYKDKEIYTHSRVEMHAAKEERNKILKRYTKRDIVLICYEESFTDREKWRELTNAYKTDIVVCDEYLCHPNAFDLAKNFLKRYNIGRDENLLRKTF